MNQIFRCVRTCTTDLYSVLETTIKLIKDRKLLLLFPQFIKYKTFELLWNLDITQGFDSDYIVLKANQKKYNL